MLKSFRGLCFVFLILFQTGVEVFSQQASTSKSDSTIFSEKSSASASRKTSLNGYGEYVFGLTIETVKTLLINDTQFIYEGEPDVTLMNPQDCTTISVAGRAALINAFFVFHKEILYEIILEMNEKFVDYFSLYKELSAKYGEPDDLDPQRVEWKFDSVALILEKPLLVKYIDSNILEKMGNRFQKNKERRDQIRENLLNRL